MTTKEIQVRILLSKMYNDTRLMITKEKDETLNMYATEIVKLFSIHDVSQQRELLNVLADNFNDSTHTYIGQPMIEETLKAFNCG